MLAFQRVSMNGAKTGRARTIGNLRIAPRVVAGAIRNAFADPHDLRDGLLRNVWIELKRFSARNVRTVDLSRIRGIDRVSVEGPVSRHGALIVSALATLLECERIFEFAGSDGETARLLEHNLPAAEIYSFKAEPTRDLGLPPTLGTRIANLSGDPNTYDF